MRIAGRVARRGPGRGRRGHRARHHHRRARPHRARGAPSPAARYPSPLNYRGFPKSLCTSVNEVICHGIPDSRPLLDGDIVNVDVTVFLDGVHGDTNATFVVGEVDDALRAISSATPGRPCTPASTTVRPGSRLNEIGRAIEDHARQAQTSASSASSSATASATSSTPSLQIPHYYEPRLRTDARGGHDLHDRADDHPRRPGALRVGRRLDRGHRLAASAAPSSSTRCWSPPTASRSSPCRATVTAGRGTVRRLTAGRGTPPPTTTFPFR